MTLLLFGCWAILLEILVPRWQRATSTPARSIPLAHAATNEVHAALTATPTVTSDLNTLNQSLSAWDVSPESKRTNPASTSIPR